jgi:hypothetical protein
MTGLQLLCIALVLFPVLYALIYWACEPRPGADKHDHVRGR